MAPVLIFDFSRVVVFPKDKTYTGKLNPLHDQLSKQPGYSFFDHFELNLPLLGLLAGLKGRYHICLYTTGHIQNIREVQERLDEVFDKVYSVEQMPLAKDNTESYRYVARGLQRPPEEILYIDDTAANIEIARKAGMNVLVYKDNDQLFHDFQAQGIV